MREDEYKIQINTHKVSILVYRFSVIKQYHPFRWMVIVTIMKDTLETINLIQTTNLS